MSKTSKANTKLYGVLMSIGEIITIALVMHGQHCFGESTNISGTITKRLYDLNTGAPKKQYFVRFQASIENTKWKIKSEYTNAASSRSKMISSEVAYDGTNMYYAAVFDTNGTPVSPSTRFIASGNASITFDICPDPKHEYEIPVWIAFASRCYYDRMLPRVKPIWVVLPDDLYRQYSVTAIVEYFSPGIVRKIAYFNNGSTPMIDQAGVLTYIKESPPYDHGFTNALFWVEDYTNITGTVKIPRKFDVTWYAPKDEGRTAAELCILQDYQCLVEKVTTTVVNDFKPTVSGRFYVTDERIPVSKSHRGYISTKWLATNDPKINDILKVDAKNKNLKTVITTVQTKRAWIIAAIALITGLSLYLTIKSRR